MEALLREVNNLLKVSQQAASKCWPISKSLVLPIGWYTLKLVFLVAIVWHNFMYQLDYYTAGKPEIKVLISCHISGCFLIRLALKLVAPVKQMAPPLCGWTPSNLSKVWREQTAEEGRICPPQPDCFSQGIRATLGIRWRTISPPSSQALDPGLEFTQKAFQLIQNRS